MPYQFPENYDDARCFLVAINASVVPILVGALDLLQQRYAWQSEEDYERGYNAFAEIKACLMKTCLDELIESNNRLYRLINAGLYGQAYTLVSVDPLVITPSIPEVPDTTISAPSALFRLGEIQKILDNGINGTISPPYVDPKGVKPLLNEILLAIQSGVGDEEILEQLARILMLLG